MSETVVYPARQIVTMDPAQPRAEAVAVRDGRILAVGPVEECSRWGPHTVDGIFADQVLVPGMIEAHAHVLEGVMAQLPYAGWFDRRRPDGTTARGVRTYTELIELLRQCSARLDDPDEALLVGGFDPIYFDGEERLTRHHLDHVSSHRPILVLHASLHLATANTAMLSRHDITAASPVPGVDIGPDGEPSGELHEAPAMSLAASAMGALIAAMGDPESIRSLGDMARNEGITVVTDLGAAGTINDAAQDLWRSVVDDDFPTRVHQYHLPAPLGGTADWDAAAARIDELRSQSTPMLATRGVKFVLDGSIQGWTAAMGWPGYFTGTDHGQLLLPPEQLTGAIAPFHRRRINVHTHCNGDLTVDTFIDAVEDAVCDYAWLDHRHTVQHCQLTSAAQYRRMARLGMCANIFANHIWYWGDQHHDLTVGPERARKMEACATAKREGVRFSLHSDASVTPLGHRHTMWCAVNRLTPSGRVLGEHERISAADALRAVTLDAAYQQHLDHELGSIECGKRADFAVLAESPLDVDPLDIKDIPVWGTVVGGTPHPAPGAD
ncbi:MAG: amidohydrolase [Acidimicrobiia bacterium]|nr:amidohydrolase [Acidimicrobiia bacterium]